MRHRLVSVLLLACVPCGLAFAQPAPDHPAPDAPPANDSGVTVNPDALNEPPPPPPPADALPTIPTLPPVSGDKPAVKSRPQLAAPVKRIPTPRQKPDVQTALITSTPAAVEPAARKPKSEKHPPVITGTAPAQPEVPVTILENSPVEMQGVATDPFASKKIVNPIAGFRVLSRVQFAEGDSQLPDVAHTPLDGIAAQLVENKKRIRLAAFSGRAGDMSSQSRRLSLERANAVRDYLVSKGVPFDHVDIMPYGGANDGVIDRVDVLLSAKS